MPTDSQLQAAAERAERLLTAAGGRQTPARRRILALLLASKRPLSHLDLEQALAQQDPIDRVTVYRVLDWLVARQLSHKIAGDDRVWRFSAQAIDPAHQHAHFHCERCGQFYCLAAIETVLPASLPPGFSASSVELTIKGICANCR